MEIASVSVSENQASVVSKRPVTSGTIGATVAFEFDETWNGMTKTLVWRGSYRTIDDISASGVIPPEVVSRSGTKLAVGVYGTKDGKVTPTIWVDLGTILPGADPSGDESTDPSLPVWAQVLEDVGKAQETGDQAKAAAEQAGVLASHADTAAKDAMVVAVQADATAQDAVVVADQADAAAKDAAAAAEQAKTIAKGRATGYVFNTVEDLDLWLSDEVNIKKLLLGDNFYIKTVDVPDYWWDGTQKQVLETQKVDLHEYVKKTDYAGTRTPGLVAVPGFDTGNYGFIKGDQEVNPGSFVIYKAHYSDIDAKTHKFRPIVPYNLDYAVKRGVAYNAKAMTTEEKKAACKWIGTASVIENSDGTITVTLPSGKTKTVDLSMIEIFL